MLLSPKLERVTSTCGTWIAHTSGKDDAEDYLIESAHRPPGWKQNKLGFIHNRMAVGHGISDVHGASQRPPTYIPEPWLLQLVTLCEVSITNHRVP